jgi:nucleoside transporter
MRTRLAALMFLEYAVQGLWAVPLAAFLMGSPHEGGLNMRPGPVALIYATVAIGATVTPLLLGLLCDRLFAVQRVLAVLHLVGAGLLAAMFWSSLSSANDARTAFLDCSGDVFVQDSGDPISLRAVLKFREAYSNPAEWTAWDPWQKTQAYFGFGAFGRRNHESLRQMRANCDEVLNSSWHQIQAIRSDPSVLAAAERAFPPMFALMLAYACVYVPTITLSNVVAFRNLPDSARQYGRFRALGTLGWIAAGVFIGFAAPAVSPLCFLFAAIASGVLGALCFFLPHTPPVNLRAKPGGSRLADALGLPALRMLAERSFLVYVLTALVATALMPFHNIYTNKFLVDLHVDHPAAVQTLAQPTEILGALLIPWVWVRIGTKWMLTLGLLASAGRFFMYATESVPGVIALGLPLHGVGFAFFYIAAALYVDREAPTDLRASAQGLVTLLTLGLGGLAGNWFAGQVVEYHTAGGVVDWGPVWLVPALGTLIAALIFAAFFRGHPVRDAS